MKNKNSENSASWVLIGKHEKVISELQKRGIRCVILKDNADIDFSVRNHADMAAYKLCDNTFIIDKRQREAIRELSESGFSVHVTDKEIAGAYPNDILLNAAKVGNTVICNEKYISREISENAERVISVRQGYSKCSVCPINENAFITDDKGIYEKCKDLFDVLLIEKGDILLENQNYGFIGGASGKILGRIYFFGSLDNHRDGKRIEAFLRKHNAEYECLFDGKLIDIGGIIEI